MVRFYLEKVISQFTPVYGLYLSLFIFIKDFGKYEGYQYG